MSEIPVPTGTPPTSGPETGRTAAPLPPPRVPDHELIRRIGRGAYGEVWLARSVTGAYRAVKIVHRQSFDHDRPFEREFEGILKFEPISRRHDSQVDILHVGRGDGCFYYVMELADDQATGGQINPDHYTPRTLKSDLLFHGRLPFEECVRIGLALGTALENLHGNGLAHRDVKPSNIIFVNGVPKLADIGLVAGVEATRSYVGTEGFAAPEGPGSPQADLYSLGKVLYEMATGKDRQEFPELPTQLRELPDRDGLMELNAVIARACRHDPKDRYPSATAMRSDLELLQGGKSLARLHRTEARLRFVQWAGAVVTAIAALAAGLYLWQARQTHIVRELAAEKTRLIEEKSKLAEENRERIVRLDVANGVRLLDAGDPSAALLWFADALPRVADRAAEEEIHRIRIQQTLAASPRLLRVVAENENVSASAFSPDGRRFATATVGSTLAGQNVALWDSMSGELFWRLPYPRQWVRDLRFDRDGRRLFISSASSQGMSWDRLPPELQLAEVIDIESGRPVFPSVDSNLVFSAFSPDDRWLAIARTNHIIELLDTRDGRVLAEISGHTNEITMLAFSADGGLLASSSRDQTVRIWRVPGGEPVGEPIPHDEPVQRVAWSADGRYIATAIWRGDEPKESAVQVWNAANRQKVGPKITEVTCTRALFFSPSGETRLFTGGEADGARIWNVGAGVTLQRMLNFPVVRCWAFSPDGRMLALGTDVGYVSIWSTETWDLLFPPFRHTGWVESVNLSSDGQQLLTTSDDGTAKLWALRQDTEAARLPLSANLDSNVPAGNQRPRGRTPGPIPVKLADEALHLIDPQQLTELDVLRVQGTNATFVNWWGGPSGRCWAMVERPKGATSKDTVVLWSREGPGWRRQAHPNASCVLQMAFNADESRLFALSCDGKVRVWRTSDGGLERSIAVPEFEWYVQPLVLPEAFRPDCGALLHVSGQTIEDVQLQLFDLATGKLAGKPFALAKLVGQLNRMRFSPDGTRLAVVGENQTGIIIDLQTGDLAVPPFKHGGSLFDLDWSPDGKQVLTAGYGVKVWDASSGEMVGAPMEGLGSAHWSADGRFIATRGDDNRVRVYDASTREPVTPRLPHSGYIRWVCITPSNRLISASDPNVLRAWDLKPTSLAADVIADYAKVLSGRRLNAGGVQLPLKSAELEQLYRSVRARAPQLFE